VRLAVRPWLVLAGAFTGVLAGVTASAALLDPAEADPLSEIVVEARGPRFVVPTKRDQIGRIWAPVYINGKGPFRLVLDTGASDSGVTAELASLLGLDQNMAAPVLLRGVTGSARVNTVVVKTLSVGDLTFDAAVLPVIPDAMGGAQGILGTGGMLDRRVWIDFRHDQIVISFSRGERAGRNFQTIPFRSLRDKLIVADALVGGIPTKAIIDTGGQATIGNLALRASLAHLTGHRKPRPDQIIDATLEVQDGEILDTPAIAFGNLQIRDPGVTYADVRIFSYWHLTQEPAILIGMDALGLLDTLVIDYRRHELQMRLLE
jgi:hypothetical protein